MTNQPGSQSEPNLEQRDLIYAVKDLSAETKQTRAKSIIVEKVKRRIVSKPFGASAQGTVLQPANCDAIKFPLCDAAVLAREGGEWKLADAIVAECSEPGEDGVRNESYAKMDSMRTEIAKNHGVELSFERIRKLRKVASAYPAGRRRPGISVEAHIEAGTPEVLNELVKAAPAGTAFTREYIRQWKHPTATAEQAAQKEERRHQVEDQRLALQSLCRTLEREKEQSETRYEELCRSLGKEPKPFFPPPAPKDEPSLTVAEELERALRRLLVSRGIDPSTDACKAAIADFVKAILAPAA